jgi:outer membrane autotransporter protein
VDQTAKGDTGGLTLSGGLSAGYDFQLGRFTLTPNGGIFFLDTRMDGFTEKGAGGLNLTYEKNDFQSVTTNLGLRAVYAWSLPWGVILPYAQASYVRELQSGVEVFNVRFASDPSNPTPPIQVRSDRPDQSYFRVTAGVSGQFAYGISGYVEYQSLRGFEFVKFNDVAAGFRMQYAF